MGTTFRRSGNSLGGSIARDDTFEAVDNFFSDLAGGGIFGGTLLHLSFPHGTRLIPFAGAGDPQTDKAAIDEAEKRVGPKKDE